MTVRVRLFAAVRDAAGTAETTVEPGRVADVLEKLRERYGEPFAARLAVSTVLVDGSTTAPDAAVEVRDGAEIAVLPPVSGGAGPRPAGRRVIPPSMALGGLIGAAAVGALAAGEGVYGGTIVVLAGLVLADLTARLSHSGPRPITVAAAVPAVALPATIALRPDTGWTAVPDFTVGGVLAAFLIALVLGRRRDVTVALGRTMLTGLVVGLGAAGLLLLRSLPEGFRWVLATVVVVTVVEAGRQVATSRAGPVAAGAVTVAIALMAAGVLAVVAAPPFTIASAAAIAAVGLLAGATSALLREALGVGADTTADGPDPADDLAGAPTAPGRRQHDVTERARPFLRAGVLTDGALPLLLGSPAAYAVARLAAL